MIKQRLGKPFDLNNINSVPPLPLFSSLACTELLVKEASGEGDGVLAEMMGGRSCLYCSYNFLVGLKLLQNKSYFS